MGRRAFGLGLGIPLQNTALAAAITDALLAGAMALDPVILYDNNDLTAFFADRAGTAATINGVCGMQFNKSEGLTLGADIQNGGFDTDTVWTKGSGWAISGGIASFTGSSAPITQNASETLSVGDWVKVTFTLVSRTTGFAYIFVAGNITNNVSEAFTVPGTYTRYVPVLSVTNQTVGIVVGSSPTGISIDNFSCQKISGHHRYQDTTASKPILRGTPVGANLLNGSDGTLDAGWANSGGGVYTATATTGFARLHAPGLLGGAGKVYRVTYDLTVTSGTVRVLTNGAFAGAFRASSGSYVDFITDTAGVAEQLFLDAGTAFTGTVSNIEVHDVSADAVAAPYFLHYDGVDDFMQTAAVDLTGTDKVTVCLGVRKLSDAAGAILLEFSPTVSSNTGSFYLSAPESTVINYATTARGNAANAAGQRASTPGDAPDTCVLTALHDISGDLSRLRRNGTTGADGTDDKGLGNFGNYVIYFGRRGGTSAPFSGYDFGPVLYPVLYAGADLAAIVAFATNRTTGATP